MTGPGGLDAGGAAEAVRRGDITPGELLDDARNRAQAWEPWLGAVVHPVARPGMSEGSLAGAVTGVKEVFAVAGIPRTCGAPEFLGDPRPEDVDATAVGRLVEAGTSLANTLSSHPLAYGVVTPQTRNPRAPDRIAGGSSGGSAAALAAGTVHLALGSDTGGSVRIPASCCGVVGFKPTRGLVSLAGVANLAWSLDTVGPLATGVNDVALALDVLIGQDPTDPESIAAELLPPLQGRVRIGVPRELAGMPIDPDVLEVWNSTLGALDEHEHELIEVSLPRLSGAHKENGVIIAAEAAAIHRSNYRARSDVLPPPMHRQLSKALDLRASRAAEARRFGALLRRDLRLVFTDVDVLCTPTLPCRVPPVAAETVTVGGVEEPVVSALTRLTGPWNIAGTPAGTVPVGLDGSGAPVGVQVIGPWLDDPRVLSVMADVERLHGGPWSSASLTVRSTLPGAGGLDEGSADRHDSPPLDC